MSDFFNALYSAIGSDVSGFRDGVPFLGTIIDTRVKYGTDVQVTVKDGDDIFLINGSSIAAGGDSVYKNLHVYF